ncbi:hypothetical protein P7K49_036898, partial [Saguinus oedipus]
LPLSHSLFLPTSLQAGSAVLIQTGGDNWGASRVDNPVGPGSRPLPTNGQHPCFTNGGSAGSWGLQGPQCGPGQQPSALSPQPSALSPQPSALSPQPSALSRRCFGLPCVLFFRGTHLPSRTHTEDRSSRPCLPVSQFSGDPAWLL